MYSSKSRFTPQSSFLYQIEKTQITKKNEIPLSTVLAWGNGNEFRYYITSNYSIIFLMISSFAFMSWKLFIMFVCVCEFVSTKNNNKKQKNKI